MRVIVGRRGLARYLAEAELRHAAELGEALHIAEQLADAFDDCVDNHRDLARRNGELQASNVRLAHQLERAELLREQAEHDVARLTAGRES